MNDPKASGALANGRPLSGTFDYLIGRFDERSERLAKLVSRIEHEADTLHGAEPPATNGTCCADTSPQQPSLIARVHMAEDRLDWQITQLEAVVTRLLG